jgi:hypothetical protein
MLKFIIRSIMGTAIIFAAVCDARAENDDVQIVKPDEPVAGHTQLYWAQTWWQWVLSIPDNMPKAPNPLFDNPSTTTTFAGAAAAIGNTGPVFFLAGTFGSGSTTRTITVPYGKPVFFPVVNGFFANFDPVACTPQTLKCALAQIPGPISKATNMTVTIDKKTITTQKINMFRQISTSFFAVTLPPSNIFGLDPGMYFQNNPVWVQDGYYIMLSNLSLGKHSLHFHGEIPGTVVDVTDTLSVVVAP